MRQITTEQEYINEVLQEGIIFVDFYADWCGPCKVYEPILKQVSQLDICKDIDFIKVNIEDLTELADREEIVSVPTTMIYKNGELVFRSAGVQQPQQLVEQIMKLKSE